jgi:hypothetical protein
VIYAAGIDRVFDVDAPGKRLTLRGLTVTGGQTIAGEPGGGIRAEAGSLTLESARVSGSSTIDGWGGAIYSVSEGAGDDTRIIDSYITNNISLGQTLVTKKIRLERSTVAGNYTDASSAIVVYGGGGIVNSTVTSHIASGNHSVVAIVGGEISIMSCTLSHPGGPVFYIQDAGVELANTIIEGTCSGPDLPSSIGGNLESPGHTCNLGSYDLGDVPGPVVSALGWFGGPTPVHRPLAGSVVIDHPWAGHECQLSDQRQAPRPRDGDGSGGVGCDIGAVELFAPGEIFLDGFECGFTTAWSVVAP